MEPTYMILGADGKQYGPVSIEQFKQWVQQGRANGATQVWKTGTAEWVAASSLPELGVAAPVATAPANAPAGAIPAAVVMADPVLDQRIRNGASWFYWIGALSLINSFAALNGSAWRFFIGLGITQVIDEVLVKGGTGGKAVALTLDVIAAGSLIVFGVLSGKRHAWAFLVGGILLALDGALVGLAAAAGSEGGLWISFAFHAWAVFMIFRGFMASRAQKA